MSTPHNMANQDEIAKIVLMPGDPLRATYIAQHYLSDVVLFNTTRNMLGYTGMYNGVRVSIMGSGMGMASIGIYSYELYKFYDVDTIIRVGSAGAYTDQLSLFDLVLVDRVWSESTYALAQANVKGDIQYPSSSVNAIIEQVSNQKGQSVMKAMVHSSDVFYHEDCAQQVSDFLDKGCMCVEMESFALFHNAKVLGKQAACLLTISDSLVTHQETTAKQRETAFDDMITLALDSAVQLTR